VVGQQRRVDAPGEVAEVGKRASRVRLQFAQDLPGLRRVLINRHPGEPELDGEGHQILLGSVVDVAFQAPPHLILRGHKALPRRP
jgi:hypothetical protein